MSIWWGEIPRNCPVCGRFLSIRREPIIRVDGTDTGEIRTIHECTNTNVDHDWGDDDRA